MADSVTVTATELIVVAVAIYFAAFIQVLSGFGFALLSMPIMTIALPVEKAVVVSTILGMIATLYQSRLLRADTQWPLAKRLIVASLCGMPLGLVILNVVSDTALKIALGVAVLVATALLAARLNLSQASNHLDHGVGFISGILTTSLSTNGPPLVFGLQARHLDAPAFRATIATVFAVTNVVGLALFVANGKVTGDGLLASAIAFPAWLLGQVSAWPVRKHVHGERFRVLVLALLFIAGTFTIVFAVV